MDKIPVLFLAAVVLMTAEQAVAAKCTCSELEKLEPENKKEPDGKMDPEEKMEPIWTNRTDLDCSSESIDAAITTKDNKTYFFKGDYYWKVIWGGVATGYPRLITQDWNGLPGHLDAAFTWKDGRIFFFKGHLYWSFHGKIMDPDYPRNISQGFCGIPDSIEAATMDALFNKAYFFKGAQYWRYDDTEPCNPVDAAYPLLIANYWTSKMPSYIDAALQWEDGFTYFFKGSDYYRKNRNNLNESGIRKEIHRNFGLKCEDLRSLIPKKIDPSSETCGEDKLQNSQIRVHVNITSVVPVKKCTIILDLN